jgi:hypothetical protein
MGTWTYDHGKVCFTQTNPSPPRLSDQNHCCVPGASDTGAYLRTGTFSSQTLKFIPIWSTTEKMTGAKYPRTKTSFDHPTSDMR